MSMMLHSERSEVGVCVILKKKDIYFVDDDILSSVLSC